MAENPNSSPSRMWRILLVLSLALNVAVIGLIGGAIARDKVGGKHYAGVEFGVGPLGRALEPEDRRAIGQSIRDRAFADGKGRSAPRRTIQEIQEILREDDLDTAKLQAVLARSATRAKDVQDAAQDALIERISQMTLEERKAFADRLDRRRP